MEITPHHQCNKCGYLNGIDHWPDPGSSEFCSHDVFDGMPDWLSDQMTEWVFKLAFEQRCPLYVERKVNKKGATIWL